MRRIPHLSAYILAVMLDGKERTLDEIVARVGRYVRPEQAVRTKVAATMSSRAKGRKQRSPGGKIVEALRSPDLVPQDVSPEDAVKWIVWRSAQNMARVRGTEAQQAHFQWLLRTETGYLLNPLARERIKESKGMAGSVANAIRDSLRSFGHYP